MRDDKLLSLAEVAEFLQLSPKTLYAQRYRGEGVGGLALKVGRHLRWRPSDLESWLDRQTEVRLGIGDRQPRPP